MTYTNMPNEGPRSELNSVLIEGTISSTRNGGTEFTIVNTVYETRRTTSGDVFYLVPVVTRIGVVLDEGNWNTKPFKRGRRVRVVGKIRYLNGKNRIYAEHVEIRPSAVPILSTEA